ncbi:hypothetical protein [Haladaptatus halobius]|uniref:hypothetical protein n=1 Tax=Haladaptatus halobius TaxID=2884875 RepID=UPI001D09B1BF|nr:hypothetical protein [Haladaptatus halobius]
MRRDSTFEIAVEFESQFFGHRRGFTSDTVRNDPSSRIGATLRPYGFEVPFANSAALAAITIPFIASDGALERCTEGRLIKVVLAASSICCLTFF